MKKECTAQPMVDTQFVIDDRIQLGPSQQHKGKNTDERGAKYGIHVGV